MGRMNCTIIIEQLQSAYTVRAQLLNNAKPRLSSYNHPAHLNGQEFGKKRF